MISAPVSSLKRADLPSIESSAVQMVSLSEVSVPTKALSIHRCSSRNIVLQNDLPFALVASSFLGWALSWWVILLVTVCTVGMWFAFVLATFISGYASWFVGSSLRWSFLLSDAL